MSTTAPVMVTTPTMPLNIAKARKAGSSSQACRAAYDWAKNQKKAAPVQTLWKVVFHLAGPMALITMPRRAATWRKTVMATSRPITSSTIQSGSATRAIGVTNRYGDGSGSTPSRGTMNV